MVVGKECNKCHLFKLMERFPVASDRVDGRYSVCRDCKNESNKKWNKDNPDKINQNTKKYKKNNPKKIKDCNLRYFEKNKQSRLKALKDWGVDNPEKVKASNRKYYANVIKKDNLKILSYRIRGLIYEKFRQNNYTKKSKTYDILGCTFKELKDHLESQFKEGMTWENRGSGWHIDHIIPVSSAINEDELIKLNHYTNLQPLWKIDNMKKGSVYKEEDKINFLKNLTLKQ